MKFIISLRNPMERAYSQWNMERDMKKEKLSFWDALQAEERRQQRAHPLQTRAFSYVDRGFYAKQLRALWEVFPRKQSLVIKSTDLMDSPAETLEKVAGFLEIKPFKDVESKIVHARPYVSKITQQELDFLKDKLHGDIKELEILLGWDCSDWLT